jgi:hypothetical protein
MNEGRVRPRDRDAGVELGCGYGRAVDDTGTEYLFSFSTNSSMSGTRAGRGCRQPPPRRLSCTLPWTRGGCDGVWRKYQDPRLSLDYLLIVLMTITRGRCTNEGRLNGWDDNGNQENNLIIHGNVVETMRHYLSGTARLPFTT